MDEIETTKDINNINEAGFDAYNNMPIPGTTPLNGRDTQTSNRLGGGTIASQGTVNVGNKLFRLEGMKTRLIVNDGTIDRVIIGKREDGTFGIDVSEPGFNVLTAYSGEMLLTSNNPDDYKVLDSSKFTYSSATQINIASPYTPAIKFQIGDRIKLTQGIVKKFVITQVNSGNIMVTGGIDYTLTNAAITAISYSRLFQPSGDNYLFNFTPAFTADAGTVTYGAGTSTFYMLGNQVIVTVFAPLTLSSALASQITSTLPISVADGRVQQLDQNIPVVAALAGTREIDWAGQSAGGLGASLQFRRIGAGNWDLDTSLWFKFTYGLIN